MVFSNLYCRLPALLLIVGLLAAVNMQAVRAKAKASHRFNRRYSTYLIPPPPAYIPAVAPEQQAWQGSDGSEPAGAVNPYKKYIYTRQGHVDPQPVKPNKYVTYWNRH